LNRRSACSERSQECDRFAREGGSSEGEKDGPTTVNLSALSESGIVQIVLEFLEPVSATDMWRRKSGVTTKVTT
jgi:hypothetical protein